tara:strand:+ start:459 stop:674 length:216 start_codon:yes stop_codon:yes gene_type:complete
VVVAVEEMTLTLEVEVVGQVDHMQVQEMVKVLVMRPAHLRTLDQVEVEEIIHHKLVTAVLVSSSSHIHPNK